MATASGAAPLAPGLARKVKKILEIKTESPDVIASLSTLSAFFTENTPAARRSLRSTIEKRGLAINERFIGAAESVIKALDDIQVSLDGLSSSCGSITRVLSATKNSTSGLLADTERLTRELEAVNRKSQLVKEFLDQYQLSPDEVAALQGEEVGPTFFSALSRVRQIHDNCRALLRTHHQRAGMELMDLMASYQEAAYERLCRWVQGQCRSIGDSDTPDVGGALQAAIRALRERPVLFKYCAEEVATARHNSMFQRFITALTRGGQGGMPRPIEIHAHDPNRYINDMLAWVHQALEGEREFVVTLFGDEREDVGKQELDDGDGGASDSLNTATLLDRIFDSICRPLKVRIEQVLLTSPPLLLCYQLSQLLGFYYALIVRILGSHAQLSVALRGCRDVAQRVFFELLKARGDKLLRHPPPPPKDLSPPPQVGETVHQLLEILHAGESALQAGASTSGMDDLNHVLAAVLDPLIEMCERSAEALRPDAPSRVDEVTRIDPRAHRVYLTNCMASILTLSSLSLRTSAVQRVQLLSATLEEHVAALVSGEVGRLLTQCGLSEIVDRLQLYQQPAAAAAAATVDGGAAAAAAAGEGDAPPPAEGAVFGSSGLGGGGIVAAADPALSLQRVAEAMRAFFVLVSSPDALPELRAIQVPRTRADAVARIARSLLESYESVYHAVEQPSNGYLEQGGTAAIKHSPAQVRTILGVVN